MASPLRYSSNHSYYNYFFEFENESFFEKYITRGFILERPMKLESFRAVGVQKIVDERGWESTMSNIPYFVTKWYMSFMPISVTILLFRGRNNLRRCLLGDMFTNFLLGSLVVFEHLHS